MNVFRQKSLDELQQEQGIAQRKKQRDRTLEEYEHQFFSVDNLFTRESKIRNSLKSIFQEDIQTLEGLLETLHRQRNRLIQWTDQGGGLALPMRELASIKDSVRMINIDLIAWGTEAVTQEVREYLEDLLDFDLEDEARKPELLLGDVTSITTPQPSDLITSCESLQYLDDPLKAICNWYNQLADDGILLVSTAHDFSSWMRKFNTNNDHSMFPSFMRILREADVNITAHNITQGRSLPPEYRRFMIRKKPKTMLQIRSKLEEVWTNQSLRFGREPNYYKAAYYDSTDRPVVVLSTEDATT